MKTLNDPVPMDDVDDRDWTPGLGLRRAALRGAIAAGILAVLLLPVAFRAPGVLLDWRLRLALSFGIAWILFSVVHRAAGMTGFLCSAMAVGYTILALLSHHLVFASNGVPTTQGIVAGAVWLTPPTIGVTTLPVLLGALCCTVLCHTGMGDLDLLLGIFNRRVWRLWRY